MRCLRFSSTSSSVFAELAELAKATTEHQNPQKKTTVKKNYTRCHHIYSMHKRESEQTTHEIVERRIPI